MPFAARIADMHVCPMQTPAVVPIPGSRTPAHIVENLAAADITLHPDTLERIDAVLARLTPVGGTLLEDER